MYEVNRSVALLRPRQPFLDWLLALPGIQGDITLEALRQNSNALLVPPDEEGSTATFIAERATSLFEAELADWCEDETLWPADRSARGFLDWFDVEVHGILTDLVDAPLEREAFIPLDTDFDR